LDTKELLLDTSDELLKACEITAGQVVRIKKALKNQAVTVDLSQCPEFTFNVVENVAESDDEITPVSVDLEPSQSTPNPWIESRAQPVFRKEEETFDEKWLSSFKLPTKVYIYIYIYMHAYTKNPGSIDSSDLL
jgi:hypothetical protein